MNGKKKPGLVDTTLPNLESKTTTITGAGISGDIDMPVSGHTNNLTVELNFRITDETALELGEVRAYDFEMFGAEVYNCPKTIISKEYSTEWKDGMEPYYPVNDKENSELYAQYKNLADQEKDVIFGGRLAEYKYYDMAPIIEKALAMFK